MFLSVQNERRPIFLVALGIGLLVHIVGVYWWYSAGALWRPLVLLPPRNIPMFWQAIFIIVVNDTVVRQAAMVLKSWLLIHFKNSRGRNYRRQVWLASPSQWILVVLSVGFRFGDDTVYLHCISENILNTLVGGRLNC
jgi:hypothetical protein